MNLCIDEGNSSLKIAVFEGESIVFSNTYNEIDFHELSRIIKEFKIEHCILSSVVETNILLIDFLIK